MRIKKYSRGFFQCPKSMRHTVQAWLPSSKLDLTRKCVKTDSLTFSFISVCMGALCVFMSMHHALVVPTDVRRGCLILWDWNYRQSLPALQMLESTPSHPEEEPVLLNSWAVSLPSKPDSFKTLVPRAWSADSAVKRAYCSFRGWSSVHSSQVNSQPPATPAPGNLTRPQATTCTRTYPHTYISTHTCNPRTK